MFGALIAALVAAAPPASGAGICAHPHAAPGACLTPAFHEGGKPAAGQRAEVFRMAAGSALHLCRTADAAHKLMIEAALGASKQGVQTRLGRSLESGDCRATAAPREIRAVVLRDRYGPTPGQQEYKDVRMVDLGSGDFRFAMITLSQRDNLWRDMAQSILAARG